MIIFYIYLLLSNIFHNRLFAAAFGIETQACLEEVLLTDDVANLAMILYGKSIQDGTFFDDTELVDKYFLPSMDAQEVFKCLHLV